MKIILIVLISLLTLGCSDTEEFAEGLMQFSKACKPGELSGKVEASTWSRKLTIECRELMTLEFDK